MTNPSAYTLWCDNGRIATFRTREAAQAYLERVAADPRKYLSIQEWTPDPSWEQYVTFDGDTIDEDK